MFRRHHLYVYWIIMYTEYIMGMSLVQKCQKYLFIYVYIYYEL